MRTPPPPPFSIWYRIFRWHFSLFVICMGLFLWTRGPARECLASSISHFEFANAPYTIPGIPIYLYYASQRPFTHQSVPTCQSNPIDPALLGSVRVSLRNLSSRIHICVIYRLEFVDRLYEGTRVLSLQTNIPVYIPGMCVLR